MVSTSIVTTQLIERRESSRFAIPTNYSRYTRHNGIRSTSLPSVNRISDHAGSHSYKSVINEYNSKRPTAIQISTQSIMLQGNNESPLKSNDAVTIHHLRRASLSERNPINYRETNYKEIISNSNNNNNINNTNINNNSNNNINNNSINNINNKLTATDNTNIMAQTDYKSYTNTNTNTNFNNNNNNINSNSNNYNYTKYNLTKTIPSSITDDKKTDKIDKNDKKISENDNESKINYAKNSTDLNSTLFGSIKTTKIPPIIQQIHSANFFEKSEKELKNEAEKSEELTNKNNTNKNMEIKKGGYSKRNIIAFIGLKPMNIGYEFESIETDEHFSNLSPEDIIALVIGNQDLYNEHLYRFNNLRIVLPLNPSYSTQLSTTSNYRVERIISNEWINNNADTTMAMILNLFKRPSKSLIKKWFLNRKSLTHRTLGIVGLGRIGLAVLERARGFQFEIVFYDPSIKQGMEIALGVKRAQTLKNLLEISDCITLHCPLNSTTKNMINNETIYSMKRGCFLVNNSNANLVDSKALRSALSTERIAAAALSYYDRNLDDLWNCVLGNEEICVDENQKDQITKMINNETKRRFQIF